MLFKYKAVDKNGETREGNVEAVTRDTAINALQRRGLVLVSVESERAEKSIWQISFFERVSNREVVILSRQISTLFEAQVSALRIFQLLGAESTNPLLARTLDEVATDIQGGSTIAGALGKHPKAFSSFYVGMVKAGEEAGKLDDTFLYLADYLDRTYEITAKARNALIYPTFVIFTFIAVMVLMLTLVIPRLSAILVESGQELPIFTKIIIAFSNFLLSYGVIVLIALAAVGVWGWRYSKTKEGRLAISQFQIDIPYIGMLYRMLYLSRIADNLSTMLSSGIPMVRALEITATVVDNAVFEEALLEATQAIKGGRPVSEALDQFEQIPGIMVQMIRVGEESGELVAILKTMAKFYRREVNNAVDTLVNMIEPILIVALGLGVGMLLAGILLPIYNISSAI